MSKVSLGKAHYLVLFKDNFLEYRIIYCIHYKTEVFQKCKELYALISQQTGN